MEKLHTTKEITIPIGKVKVNGIITLPEGAEGIVLFAHGSGSGRFSKRNNWVAKFLNEENLATLLLDLLTVEEEKEDDISQKFRFDIPFLAKRLNDVTNWIAQEHSDLQLGYFGASTGAGAALVAASQRKDIAAIVSRGGRPDLAKESLTKVISPTLLIVGGSDSTVLELNREAYALLPCEKRMEIVPNATHLFEESGALEHVAHLAASWFTRFFQ